MTDSDDDGLSPAERLMFTGLKAVPHMVELGIVPVHAARGMAICKLPYRQELVGNPDTGVIHGGVVTTLIDSVAGFAAISAPNPPQQVATLDLRIDYLRPAEPGRDLFARAEVYKLTSQIAFLNAVAYEDDPQDLVASATGTFMFTGKRRLDQNKSAPTAGKPMDSPAGGGA